MIKDDIAGLGLKELIKKMMAMGEPPLRAKQVYRWVHKKAVADFSHMTDIPAALKGKLAGSFTAGALKLAEKLVSKDGTEKYLWELRDQKLIEAVLIKDKERNTVCLSTQVGCKFRCPFCASGKEGFKRNLTAGEIVGQLLGVKREAGVIINNVVFMGMGEPLDNFENLKKAITLINDPEGMGLGARKITVSTSGIVPGIKRMKELGLQAELSVSLHATNNEERNKLVPANIAYPIEDLVDACKAYFHDTKRIVTLEYIMMEGKNDSLADAARLIKLAREMHARVNLIACNASGAGRFKPSGAVAVDAFRNRLMLAKINVSVRRSRGGSIFAACGQLAGARAKKVP